MRPSTLSTLGPLLLLVIATFATTLNYPLLHWDDHFFITDNLLVQGYGSASWADRFFTPKMGYIVPVPTALQALLFHLGKGAAWPFHATNLLLHLTVVLQAFSLARRFVHGASPRREIICLLLTLPVAFHPLVVEPVAWATGMKDLLLANFALLGSHLLLNLLARYSLKRLLLFVGAAALAMLSKPTGAALPVAWLFFALISARKDQVSLTKAALYALVALSLGSVFLVIMNGFTHSVMVSGSESAHTQIQLVEPFYAVGFHTFRVFWPFELHSSYPEIKVETTHNLLLGVFTIVLHLILCWRLWRRPEFLLALTLSLAAYAPVSNLLHFNRSVADCYLYLPLALLGVAYASLISEKVRINTKSLCGLIALLTLFWLPLSLAQTTHWKSDRALWTAALEWCPDNTRYLVLLAGSEVRAKNHEAAVPLYERVYQLGDYRTDEMMDFAISLELSERLNDAECVYTEYALLVEPEEGPLLHALFLFRHPQRPSSYPALAAASLKMTLDKIYSGQIMWPADAQKAFEALTYSYLSKTSASEIREAALKWEKRTCAVLQEE